ncbi:hypothetical protein VNO77_02028 [Canavalia gladiata]|uniref:Uncharacterized protein n=1 Tax=Canavalia gladiata TaxID=3824 RepID=A0AAN9MU91_CANGL
MKVIAIVAIGVLPISGTEVGPLTPIARARRSNQGTLINPSRAQCSRPSLYTQEKIRARIKMLQRDSKTGLRGFSYLQRKEKKMKYGWVCANGMKDTKPEKYGSFLKVEAEISNKNITNSFGGRNGGSPQSPSSDLAQYFL